jgi:hypothetical protein
MSQIRKGILGALAVATTFGAVQLASGHDLAGDLVSATAAQIGLSAAQTVVSQTGVNRAAKADRGAVVTAPYRTETIALKLDSLAESSVVIRVPVVRQESRSRPAAPLELKTENRRPTVACEPVVSVLTEIAKSLAPGRCVT